MPASDRSPHAGRISPVSEQHLHVVPRARTNEAASRMPDENNRRRYALYDLACFGGEVGIPKAFSAQCSSAVEQLTRSRELGMKVYIDNRHGRPSDQAFHASGSKRLHGYPADVVRNPELLLRRLYPHPREIGFGKLDSIPYRVIDYFR